MFGKFFRGGEAERAERIIERVRREREPLRNLGSIFIHFSCQCQTQIWALFPKRSKPDVELFPLLQMEILGLFLSMVERAADFNHLTKEQRENIYEALMPALVEGLLDNYKPPLPDDLRQEAKGEFSSIIGQTVVKYLEFAGVAIFTRFVVAVGEIMETHLDGVAIRKIASIAEKQVHAADFGKLVIAVKKACEE
jgi:hypothetical protein